MNQSQLKIEYIDISQLKPYENNAKVHTEEQIAQIMKSIEEFGMNDPIAVWQDNEIIEGHGRLMACQKLGIKEVPIIRLDNLTDEQRRAYMNIHNQLTMNTGFDIQLLEEELKSITNIDMSQFGFDIDFLKSQEEIVEDDYELDQEIEKRVKLGDIWQLGKHRLICGDATDIVVIKKLMNGVKVDMVFTDPPYGINIVNDNGKVGAGNLAKNRTYSKVIADDSTDTAQEAYHVLSTICDKMILWGGGNYFTKFLPFSDGWIIWDKRIDMKSNNFADGEMGWCSFHTPVRIYHQLWNGMIREGQHEDRVHPTQKPTKMLGEVLKDFSKENDVIVDVFGGSGSTLIACEQLNRRCYMCELDEHYCDVIINRWETFTGQKAILIEEDSKND